MPVGSVTGELLAQRGRRRAGLGRVRRGVAATGGLGVGLGERLDLGAVRLPTGVRLGVLLLPGLALLLEALEPLVGLRVEALGVLVVTLLVVLGGHAVQGRVELD